MSIIRVCIYVDLCACILHLLRTNMSCKWDENASFARIVGAESYRDYYSPVLCLESEAKNTYPSFNS